MFATIIARARATKGGEDGWVGIRSHNENKSRSAFLADELIRLTKDNTIHWTIAKQKDFATTTSLETTIVLIKHPGTPSSRVHGATQCTFTLVLFRFGVEVLRLSAVHDTGNYDTNSRRIPVMDLFDVVTMGAFRKPSVAHVCGLQGFGAIGDTCPACHTS